MEVFEGQLVEVGILCYWQARIRHASEAQTTVVVLMLTEPKDLSLTMARPWPNGCGIVNHATKVE